MENIILTISERLGDLRKNRDLTLDELAEATGISRSALGKYENQDFKDISPLSIVTLAKFYGVSTDYLLGVSNLEKQPNAELHELRLSDAALDVLKNGKINGKLLSDVISHKDFERLLADMEIYVDGLASMQIGNLNSFMAVARKTVQTQYHPDENEEFYRTLELTNIPGDEYISYVLREDLKGILYDIREKREEVTKDTPISTQLTELDVFQRDVQSILDGKGSREEKVVKVFLANYGIDYDKLTPEQLVVLMDILRKSDYMEMFTNRRGKRQVAFHKKRKK